MNRPEAPLKATDEPGRAGPTTLEQRFEFRSPRGPQASDGRGPSSPGWRRGEVAERREPTQTSRFGVSRRENHDASAFYARFTPPKLSADSAVHPDKAVDEIFVGDAREMKQVPDGSVALVATSPPYFAGKEYEEALGEGHIPA